MEQTVHPATNVMEPDYVAVFGRIQAVDTILRVLQRATNLRTSLVARVTSDSWTACAVLDDAGYGLKPGDNLELHTTF